MYTKSYQNLITLKLARKHVRSGQKVLNPTANKAQKITYTCLIKTPLGTMRAAALQECLTGLWFTGQKKFPDTKGWIENPDYPVFKKLKNWLIDYFAGKAPKIDIKLNPEGSGFQKKIWKKLMAVPYGKTMSYSQLFPPSGRAAGGAVGRNPVSILIPCHRIIGKNGDITGYAAGIDKKKVLLELEGIILG